MKHIYENVSGWFTFPNLYSNMVKKFSENSHFVEIGTWAGKSATYMAVEIINSGKKIKFDCIDTWEGSPEHMNFSEIINDTLYSDFLKNIEPVKENINPVKLDSIKASVLYADESLDFVFIDATHEYENVKNDINAWFPKVKRGGILAGHDYPTWQGVVQAVNEFLQKENYNLNINSESCWGIIKR